MTENKLLTKKREKLKHFILPLLRCVHCGSENLILLKREIKCPSCREVYPLFRETPIMMLQPDQAFDYRPSEVVTREYNRHWYQIMEKAWGEPILDLGSGNNPGLIDNLIKFDMFALPTVEVVGDAEKVPFKKQSFRVIFSSSVFEHFRNPWRVADNLHELLKYKGEVYIEAGFLAPWHGSPHHFFNMTKQGIEELFSRFEKLDSGTLPHMYPSFTLMWILNVWLNKQTPEQRKEFCNTTVGEIQAEYAKNLLSPRWMENFSQEDREELACGVFFLGRKYRSDSKYRPVPFAGQNHQEVEVSASTLSEEVASSSHLTRFDKVMCMVDKNGLGLEIGPSFNPLAPKKDGFNVQIVDHVCAEELRVKYQGHGTKFKEIEEVDYIWKGGPLTVLIGQDQCYDWIIASHVIEHIPDLISFLSECEKLLKPTGVLSLVIPDKRYCFDYFHGTTTTGELLDAFDQKRNRPSPGKVFDHSARAAKRNGQIAWGPNIQGDLEFVHTISVACQNYQLARATDAYIDVHTWRFTPSSFRLLLGDLRNLGLTSWAIKKSFDTEGCEFFVSLTKVPHVTALEETHRMELLKSVREDEETPT